jgi:hypothetical protein
MTPPRHHIAPLLATLALLLLNACGGDTAEQVEPWDFNSEERPDQGSTPDQTTAPDLPVITEPDMMPPPPDLGVPDLAEPDADIVMPPPTSPDGEACASDADCAGGSCILDDGWPDGYCTTVACQQREDCARGEANEFDNRCLRGRTAADSICVRMCTAPADCREGYACTPLGNGQSICVPDTSTPIEELERYPFNITCADNSAQSVSIDYTVAQNTSSYMIVPLARDKSTLQPRTIARPSGQVINLRGDNAFQLYASQLFGWLSPTIVPAAPQFAAQLEPGDHSYLINTNSASVCHYLLEESTPGTTIDINVYLVGVPGVTPANAANSPSFQTMFQAFNELYASSNVQIGQIRYYTLSPADVQRYQIVRSESDTAEIVAKSTLPGTTRDEVLSLNVFFVRAMGGQLGQQGVLGISLGLPGPAGLHGTEASGVIFTSEYLGQQFRDPSTNQIVNGDRFTGLIFSHEVGHYLGLLHTIDGDGGRGTSYDPLDDTPRCTSGFPDSCPDVTNMMFPLAGIDHTVVSPGQSWMIQASPLTKD